MLCLWKLAISTLSKRDWSVNHQCKRACKRAILNRWSRGISGQSSREWSSQNEACCCTDNPSPLIISREACVRVPQSNETYGPSICGLIRRFYPRPVTIFGLKPATFIDKICFSHQPYVLNGLLLPRFRSPTVQTQLSFLLQACGFVTVWYRNKCYQ